MFIGLTVRNTAYRNLHLSFLCTTMSGGGDLVTEEDLNCKIEINVLKGISHRYIGGA
jgi:hypothetical protein